MRQLAGQGAQRAVPAGHQHRVGAGGDGLAGGRAQQRQVVSAHELHVHAAPHQSLGCLIDMPDVAGLPRAGVVQQRHRTHKTL